MFRRTALGLLASTLALAGLGFGHPSTASAAETHPHIWSDDSPAYKSLEPNAPLYPHSSEIVANIKKYGVQQYGD